jgi:hypothetical protein
MALAPEKSDLIGLFPIAHEDQTAFIVCNEKESAIFFDVGQSAVLKSAFASLRSADPQQTAFRLFLGTASLKISPGDRFLADKLGDAISRPYDGPPLVDKETLEDARGALFRYAHPSLQSLFDTIVDFGIVAHELYHYRAHRSLIIDELDQFVAAHYAELVQTATVSAGPLKGNFESPAKLGKFNRELLAKQDYYNKERRMISEEIACDLYAFTSVAEWLLRRTTNANEMPELLEMLIALNSISFNFHLLHLAFTERAVNFADGIIGSDLPGSMSLYNLRRVAIGVLSSHWSAAVIAHASASAGSGQIETLAERFQILQNRIYVEMANIILAPAIPMLNTCFASIDQTFPRETRPSTEPTVNTAERLFFSSLAFRLDANVLKTMLKSGPDGLQGRVLPFSPL